MLGKEARCRYIYIYNHNYYNVFIYIANPPFFHVSENDVSFVSSVSPFAGNLLRSFHIPGDTFFADTPNFPSKTPQNRFKPFRGILYHPNPRNALKSALKRKIKIQRILSQKSHRFC